MSSVVSSLIGVLKTLVDDRVWREGFHPANPVFPYISVLYPISDVPVLTGDTVTLSKMAQGQATVWFDGTDDEDLVKLVEDSLDSQQFSADEHVIRVRVDNTIRMIDPETDLTHYIVIFRIVRLK